MPGSPDLFPSGILLSYKKIRCWIRTSDRMVSSATSTAAVDPRHLKVEVADYDFPNCSYVINRTLPITNVNYVNKEY